MKSRFKQMEYYWKEFSEEIDKLKRDILEAQILMSTMRSKYFHGRLKGNEKSNLEKADIKIQKILKEFYTKVLNIKLHSNFDVFTFMRQQSSSIYKDINNVHKIVGPFLSRIYGTELLHKIMEVESEEKQKRFEEYEEGKCPKSNPS